MRKIQRLASASAIVALVVTASACGSTDTPTTSAPTPSTPTTSTSAAAGDDDTGTFGPACDQLPQGNAPGSLDSMGPQPVATAASTNPMLKTLVTAVKAANLVDTLNSQEAITVFAPYDAAFAEVKRSLGDAKFNALLADKEQLGNVLKYHVVARRLDKPGLLAEPNGSVATLAGGTLKVTADGDDLKVTDGAGNTANVLCGNIPTKNATVFVIDKVLMAKQS